MNSKAFSKIGILIILIILIGGGILVWQYVKISEQAEFLEKEQPTEDLEESKEKIEETKETEGREESYIKVLSPNGGENWVIGDTYDITWESRGFQKVFIILINEEVPGEWGQKYWICRLTPGYISAEEGKYSWKVGSGECSISPGEKFKIEVKEPEGMVRPRADDESDNYFSIVSE